MAEPMMHVNAIRLRALYACVYGGWGARDIDQHMDFQTGGTSAAPLAALDQVSLA